MHPGFFFKTYSCSGSYCLLFPSLLRSRRTVSYKMQKDKIKVTSVIKYNNIYNNIYQIYPGLSNGAHRCGRFIHSILFLTRKSSNAMHNINCFPKWTLIHSDSEILLVYNLICTYRNFWIVHRATVWLALLPQWYQSGVDVSHCCLTSTANCVNCVVCWLNWQDSPLMAHSSFFSKSVMGLRPVLAQEFLEWSDDVVWPL